ncbi:MAG: thioredoxin fold domain-containing protein [Gammaproteobacteria bacterium]|nr:thioredoxin fold domain-containing protein [Gammaproteobacteria bacterium]
MKKGLIAFVFLFSCTSWALAPRDPYEFFFDQHLGDFSEELEVAKEDGKKGVFVFFEMDECPFCHRMKETILNQPEVQKYFKANFLTLAVDIEGDVEMVDFEGNATTQKEFAAKNRVRATPVMVFYDLDAKQVVRYTGAASGTEEFMWLVEFFEKGIYKLKDKNGRPIRFTKYKRMKKKLAKK